MRLSAWLAQRTDLSRRKADDKIAAGEVTVDGQPASLGYKISGNETIKLGGQLIEDRGLQTVLLNKPIGYVCSRQQQDDKPTIYDLLPPELQHLSYAGRLDADSDGLVIMTNNGQLINQLTHPSFKVPRSYLVSLDRPLTDAAIASLNKGVELDDGLSKFDQLTPNEKGAEVMLHEGRNRQVRRTFDAIGYQVTRLTRTSHGQYQLAQLGADQPYLEL